MFNTREKKERSLGIKLFLKAVRCQSGKCATVRRPTRPGMHGKSRMRAPSEYGMQLREKQKFQYSYGLREAQLKRIFTKALKNPAVTGNMLMSLLERRLDNIVFRLGFVPSRSVARQVVNHGHIVVNGRKTNISSYQVRIGDVIAIRPQSSSLALFKDLATNLKKYEPPVWLSLDKDKIEGKVIALPKDFDTFFDVNMVVDFYSKAVK